MIMSKLLIPLFTTLNKKRNFIGISNPVSVLLFLISFLLLFSDRGYSQCNDILVIKLKDNREYIGRVIFDTENGLYKIRTLDKEYYEFEKELVAYISTYQEVKIAPSYVSPPECEDCNIPCRYWPWYYFLELRGVYGQGKNDHYGGGEGVLGIRPYPLGIGIGASYLKMKDVYRIPVFLHLRLDLSSDCLRPFIFVDGGYVFDKIGSDYKVKPSFDIFTKAHPKMAGAGIGLDYAITTFMDLSLDAGYRYFHLPAEMNMNTCDGIVKALGYYEMHTFFVRFGITF